MSLFSNQDLASFLIVAGIYFFQQDVCTEGAKGRHFILVLETRISDLIQLSNTLIRLIQRLRYAEFE